MNKERVTYSISENIVGFTLVLTMTANQLAYQANLEKERSNRANEDINFINARAQATKASTDRSRLVNETRDSLTKEYSAQQQAQRWKHQSVTDSVNATTSGIKNITSGIGSLISPFM